MIHRFVLMMAVFTLPAPAAAADAADSEQLKFFENHVRPVLAQHCLSCHGEESQKARLRLDSRGAMLKGGESGEAVIVPGKPDASLLISAVRYESFEMPPKGQLAAKDIAVLVKWIEQGAFWPGGDDALIVRRDSDRITDEDRKWWAVQPVTDPRVPASGDGWARNEVDRFVAQKLGEARLSPAREADRHELVRRAYFDLHGLPPTPEQVEAFVSDDRPDAWQRLVRELLDSPRYGERWAQHWLDVVRYAESDGYNEDAFRPDASAFRDYVIRSLNDDKPYDQFVREHLAGDEIDPDNPDVFIGTAFLRHGVYEWNQRNARMHWDLIINEMTRVTGEAFLGIGVGCAECHDHKYDPILQKDYFGLQAFLSSVAWPMDRPLATPEEIAAHQKQKQKWEAATEAIRKEMLALTQDAFDANQKYVVKQFPEDIQAIYDKPESEKTTHEKQLSYLVWRQAHRAAQGFDHANALKKAPGKLQRYEELEAELKKFDSLKPAPLPIAFVATDHGPRPAQTFLLTRTTREEVGPSFLTVFDNPKPEITPTATSTGRRTALADWITRDDNPLSTRVIVNRIWQHHFGRGIVPTPNDFGTLGEPPSHPELLDWLTRRFHESGWRFKPLHELIMNSAAYRQTARREPAEAGRTGNPSAQVASTVGESSGEAAATIGDASGEDSGQTGNSSYGGAIPAIADPTNRLLWRFPPRRLDAEQVRDAMLAASGELQHREGGPSVSGTTPNRSVYVIRKRNRPDDMLGGFDAPLGFESAPSRISTTTPVQSLLLVNGDWTLDRSRAFARRLLKGKNELSVSDIRDAYRLAYGREASDEEVTDALAFIRESVAAPIANPLAEGAGQQSDQLEKFPGETGLRPVAQHFGAVDGIELGSRVLWIQPGSRFERLHLRQTGSLADEFTVEAVANLDRLYADASVNTLLSRWNGSSTTDGWGIGVTSEKSAYQPRNFIVQLVGRTFQDEPAYEVVASGLRFPLGKPVYLAAVISATTSDANPTGGSVTFYLKDLSDPNAATETSTVATNVVSRIQNPALRIVTGGRDGNGHLWDGQVARLTVSRGALPREQLLIGSDSGKAERIVDWKFDGDNGEQPATHAAWLRQVPADVKSGVASRTLSAVTDFCQALFNSNEFLYLH